MSTDLSVPPLLPRWDGGADLNGVAGESRRGIFRPKSTGETPMPSVFQKTLFGTPVEVACEVDWLGDEIACLLDPFQASSLAEKAGDRRWTSRVRITGSVRAYDQADVLRHVSGTAVRVANARPGMNGMMELYQDAERFWLVDDQWGMMEINLLKKSWRSWMLPYPTLDLGRCAEWAALWPLAQLLSGPELALLPAISIVREGWGVLIFSPLKMEAELEALSRDGFEVIGPRWSCLREVAGEVRMQNFPGGGEGFESTGCDAVVMVEATRRAVSRVDELARNASLHALHRHWPIVPLHRSRRQISVKLASDARCCEVQLSRQPGDLVKLMDALQRR